MSEQANEKPQGENQILESVLLDDEGKKESNEIEYPSLVRRYQAVLIDTLFMLVLFIICAEILKGFEGEMIEVKIALVVLILSYVPIFTAFSSTLGQKLMGVRVRKISNPTQRINILQAVVRIIVKTLLGWLSFLSINFNSEHRAIHDFAASSIVVRK